MKKIMTALLALLSIPLLSAPYKSTSRTSSSTKAYKGSSPIKKASSSSTPSYTHFLSYPENQKLLLKKHAEIMNKSYSTSSAQNNNTPVPPVAQQNVVFSPTTPKLPITDRSKLPVVGIKQPSQFFIPRAEGAWVIEPEQNNLNVTTPQKPLTQSYTQQPVRPEIVQQATKLPKIKKSSQEITTSSKKQTPSQEEAPEKAPLVAKSLGKYLTQQANTRIFDAFKLRMRLSSQIILSQVSATDIIVEELGNLLLKLQGLSKNPGARRTPSLDGFKSQIQYLAEQIKLYNNQTIYKNPDQIVVLIKFMNRFIKENNIILISQTMSEKLQTINKTAQATCSMFQNANIILSIFNAPAPVILEFEDVIEKTHNLQNMQFTKDLVQTIYNKNGIIDQIFNAWKNFQTSATYQDNPINRQYGAFVTFLLLFENTMVATATILAITSELYEVTNPIPVVINITQ